MLSSKVLILCFVLYLLFASSIEQSLRFVQLVYRHGDRSPVVTFPKDYYLNYHWPQGLGWLSTKGIQRHYRFGQWLRQRYDGFLNSTYIQSQIQVDSSNEDRCLMSAYSNLAGLYPPNGLQLWNDNITWQPIPVHTRPEYEDNVINMGMKCPRYDELYSETLKSKEVLDLERQNKDFYKLVSDKSGMNISIGNLWKVSDTVYIENLNGLRNNTWVYQKWHNTTVYNELRRLESIQFHLLYKGKETSKLKGGPLLKEMINNMQDYIKSKDRPSLAHMHMFSGHDTTVAALLSALELFKKFPSPPYAASVLLELHEASSNKFTVRMFYKQNETFAEPLTLPGCATDCPIEEFVHLTKSVVPVDWKKECGYPQHSSRGSKLTMCMLLVSVSFGIKILF